MKCDKQPARLKNTPAIIENIWEVRIDPALWKNIVLYAKKFNLTYSWVVRYCVFRLVQKKTLRKRPAMENLSREIKANQPSSRECHRHMMCLYGNDEKLLRLAAMQLGLTVSQLIRLALHMYMRHFEVDLRLRLVYKNHFALREFYALKRIENDTERKQKLAHFWLQYIGRCRPRALGFHSVFWYGIKLAKTVTQKVELEARLPLQIKLDCTRFNKKDWFAIRYPHPVEGYPMAA